MEQLPRFVDPHYPTHVCKLDKSFYDLKQSPRAWYAKLNNSLLHLGFVTFKNDSFLFICHSSHGLLLVLVREPLHSGYSPYPTVALSIFFKGS